MRILVVGAGVIGTIYGWALSEAGHDVTHLVRPGRAACLADGVAMDVLDKRKGRPNDPAVRYPVAVTESVEGRHDLVIVPTKPYQLTDALRQLVPAVDADATYVLLVRKSLGEDRAAAPGGAERSRVRGVDRVRRLVAG